MAKKKVISRKDLPTKSPLATTILCALALDYWNAPEWLWGVLGVIFIFFIISWIKSLFDEDEIRVLEVGQSKEPKIKAKFREILEKAMKKSESQNE